MCVELPVPEHARSLLAASSPCSAHDIVCSLLHIDESRRLGLLAGGVRDIMAHSFYAELDWPALQALSLPPPFRPNEHEWGQATTSPADSKRVMAELQKMVANDAAVSQAHEDIFRGY